MGGGGKKNCNLGYDFSHKNAIMINVGESFG